MAISFLRQFGELLDKTVDVVPAILCLWNQEYLGGVLTFEMPTIRLLVTLTET